MNVKTDNLTNVFTTKISRKLQNMTNIKPVYVLSVFQYGKISTRNLTINACRVLIIAVLKSFIKPCEN